MVERRRRERIEKGGKCLLGEHLLDALRVGHQDPDLDLLDQVPAALPVCVLQRLGRLLDAVPRRLGRAHERLPVCLVQQPLERLARHPSTGLVLSTLGEHRDLTQHARHEEGSLGELEVDVHVEGQRSELVRSLLLGRDLGVLLGGETLGEELLGSLGGEHVEQDRSALCDEAHSEGGQSELDDSSVVEDLGALVGVLDSALKMRHEEHVARLVVAAVEGVVVDVGEHGARSDKRVGGLVEVDAEGVDEGRRVGVIGDDGRGEGGSGFARVLLEVEDDGVGLEDREKRYKS
jgi:hypothetical protein